MARKVAKDSVDYRRALQGSPVQCARCSMFLPVDLACTHVSSDGPPDPGHIEANGACDDWKPA